ncbi:hypothetical protein EMCRGX_G015873 [Ephydatia muelleri]
MWKGILSDVKSMIAACDVCQKSSGKPLSSQPEQHPAPIHSPWYHVGIDFIGPITPASLSGNRVILTLSDYYTKWVDALPLPIDGDPAPSITWFRGNPLQPLTTFNGTVVNGTLIIQNVTEGVDSSATGVQYQCRASNSFGTILSKPINVSTSYFGGFQGPLSITYGEHNSECSG